ncbi:MAG TPA: nuclear transport factor 2 family protein, partial [Dongiaceae bacterium]|nr:nuclear transport factor 2 family protein [Dongiaceae bacterium]
TSAQDEVMKAVRQFVDGFNKGDSAGAIAACAEQVAILDEFPPHEWHGAGACATWVGAYDADAVKNGISDGVVTLHKPMHVEIMGDVAYVVVPADYVYKKHGKVIKETNSILTLTLRKGATGWLLTGWAWAKH